MLTPWKKNTFQCILKVHLSIISSKWCPCPFGESVFQQNPAGEEKHWFSRMILLIWNKVAGPYERFQGCESASLYSLSSWAAQTNRAVMWCRKSEGGAGAHRSIRGVSAALVTSVSSQINVMPPVRQISRVQSGLFRRTAAPTVSGWLIALTRKGQHCQGSSTSDAAWRPWWPMMFGFPLLPWKHFSIFLWWRTSIRDAPLLSSHLGSWPGEIWRPHLLMMRSGRIKRGWRIWSLCKWSLATFFCFWVKIEESLESRDTSWTMCQKSSLNERVCQSRFLIVFRLLIKIYLFLSVCN